MHKKSELLMERSIGKKEPDKRPDHLVSDDAERWLCTRYVEPLDGVPAAVMKHEQGVAWISSYLLSEVIR